MARAGGFTCWICNQRESLDSTKTNTGEQNEYNSRCCPNSDIASAKLADIVQVLPQTVRFAEPGFQPPSPQGWQAGPTFLSAVQSPLLRLDFVRPFFYELTSLMYAAPMIGPGVPSVVVLCSIKAQESLPLCAISFRANSV